MSKMSQVGLVLLLVILSYQQMPLSEGHTQGIPEAHQLFLPKVVKKAPQAASPEYELLGHIGGPTYAVAVDGQLAYIGEGASLTILNIFDPRTPRQLATLSLPGAVNEIELSNGYVYVLSADTGISIIDVSDPSAPHSVGYIEAGECGTGMAVKDGIAFVPDGWMLRILDLTNPQAPRELTHYDGPYIYRVQVEGNRAFLATEDGLVILDVSTPAMPNKIGHYSNRGRVRTLAVHGDYVYLGFGNSAIDVVSIADLARPQSVTTFTVTRRIQNIHIHEAYLYVAQGYPETRGSLSIVDISDPEMPQITGAYHSDLSGSGIMDVALSQSYAYIAASRSGLHVLDVSQVAEPQAIGAYGLGFIGDFKVLGNYGYGADRIWDLSNPRRPRQVGHLDTPSFTAIIGHYGYVWVGNTSLRIWDLTIPTNPQEVTRLPSTWQACGPPVLAGHYLYIPAGNAGLRILDIADPRAPNEVGAVDTFTQACSLAIDGHLALVVDLNSSLHIIDIMVPSAPRELAIYSGSPRTVQARHGLAYIGESWVMTILDLAIPTEPKIAYQRIIENGYGSAMRGDLFYLTSEWGGIWAMKLVDPRQPDEILGPATPSECWTEDQRVSEIQLNGDYLYVFKGYEGVFVYKVYGLPPE